MHPITVEQATMTIDHISIDIDSLSKYIFLENSDNKLIYLDIQGLECTKDIFCLCFDLLCKGLVLLYGHDNKVELNHISMEQFHAMSQRLLYAGIKVKLNAVDADNDQDYKDHTSTEVLSESYKYLKTQPDNLDVGDYSFLFKVNELIYTLKFEITRV
jgi:hypothetical protein